MHKSDGKLNRPFLCAENLILRIILFQKLRVDYHLRSIRINTKILIFVHVFTKNVKTFYYINRIINIVSYSPE